jgi:hypothetical protein
MVHPVGKNVPLAIAPVCNSVPILERTSNQLASWSPRVISAVLAAGHLLPVLPGQQTL